MTSITANGLRFEMARTGSGAPLVFLGGTGWDLRQVPNPLSSPLAENFDVLLYDQRGMGQTDKPPGPYTMADYAEDAFAIMQAIGWENAHVIGYSFGGMVAQELAIRYPERVRSLVLAATTAGGAGGSSYPLHELVDLDPMDRARRGIEVADLRFSPQWQKANPEAAKDRIDARIAKQAQFAGEPGAREGMLAQLMARAEHDSFDRLVGIKAPTLVMAGCYDGQAPVPAQRRMAEQIADCQFEEMDGSHTFLFENPAVYERMVQFCLEHT